MLNADHYGGTQRPPPHKLTPLFPHNCARLFPREFTGKEWSQFLGKEWSVFTGRWPLCTTVDHQLDLPVPVTMNSVTDISIATAAAGIFTTSTLSDAGGREVADAEPALIR